MWFKNLKLYRLDKDWCMSASELEQLLVSQRFKDGQFANEPLNMGWIPVFEEEGLLVHAVGKVLCCRLQIEKKLLTTAVINHKAKEVAKAKEKEQGYAVGKKQMKDIKKDIKQVMLRTAFSTYRETNLYFDVDNHWLIIDAGANNKADEVIKMLANVLKPLPILSFMTEKSPNSCMTEWLLNHDAPADFSIDHDTELKSMTDSRISVRYANHSPDQDELSKHITSGKTCTKLEMTWNDRISFVLNEDGSLKKLTPIEVLTQSSEQTDSDDVIENFDAEMALMAGEFNGLLVSLTEALGGEKQPS